jgi:hypothetical protein
VSRLNPARRKRRRRHAHLAVAWVQVLYGGGGMAASGLGLVGASEPKLVLHLSWAALFFTGLVGLIAADDG